MNIGLFKNKCSQKHDLMCLPYKTLLSHAFPSPINSVSYGSEILWVESSQAKNLACNLVCLWNW